MSSCAALDLDLLRRHPLPPVEEGDKNSHGKLLVIAGSTETPGSAVIAAMAALRSGCGKVSIATVEPMAPHIAMAVPEALVLALPMSRDGGISKAGANQLVERLERFDAVVAGPGMMPGKSCERLARKLLQAGIDRLVLDAAMLYALMPHEDAARDAPVPILLPHDREMAALIGCEEEQVRKDPLGCGRECARRYGALVLVKGPQSHVVDPDGSAWKYEGGGPGLGASGSGDALAGIAGAILARGADPLTALLWSVWLHGEAGSSLARKVGTIGYLARELAGELPGLLEQAQPSLR